MVNGLNILPDPNIYSICIIIVYTYTYIYIHIYNYITIKYYFIILSFCDCHIIYDTFTNC